jgi:hypothetical protein
MLCRSQTKLLLLGTTNFLKIFNGEWNVDGMKVVLKPNYLSSTMHMFWAFPKTSKGFINLKNCSFEVTLKVV